MRLDHISYVASHDQISDVVNRIGSQIGTAFIDGGIHPKFGRKAADGSRTRPDGSELKWKQIGVKEIIGAGELPFFIQWLTDNHPSKDGNGVAKISKLVIADDEKLADSWFQDEIKSALTGVEIEWVKPELNEGDKGIVAVELTVNNSKIRLD